MQYLKERAALLRVKACDLRLDALYQCRTSVDRGIHIGGAFSAIPALAALYYGGSFRPDVRHPTSADQDVFILSKGHAVAALAAVYADIGYFPREYLVGSRGHGALVKGHPGPILPGVPVATGPLGHGLSISAGFALTRKQVEPPYRVYCMVGDGELQEGSNWEGVQFAADRNLSNLCLLVDANHGQSDNTTALVVNMDRVAEALAGFGFAVRTVDASDTEGMLGALAAFSEGAERQRPTAIVFQGKKGQGGYDPLTGKHKAVFTTEQLDAEEALQREERKRHVEALRAFAPETLQALAAAMGYRLEAGGEKIDCARVFPPVQVQRAEKRDKALRYPADGLMRLAPDQDYGTTQVLTQAMETLAADARLYTVDADLSNASGLYDGTARVDKARALNVGIAECNMMCIGEALAAEGNNVWTSTFTPFFDAQAFRRIAVSYEERQEAIDSPGGWLAAGHNLDITFVATAANLDTGVNGATHMGNDDICMIRQLAHVRVIDISCPQLLQQVVRWIAQGNRGLVYLRTMRLPSRCLYPPDYTFEYGKAALLREPGPREPVLVTSGHGVLEALEAAEILAKEGRTIGVLDMHSFDGEMLARLLRRDKGKLVFAEQNNGAWFDAFARYALAEGIAMAPEQVLRRNALDAKGEARFIGSGTYEELVKSMRLDAEALAALCRGL